MPDAFLKEDESLRIGLKSACQMLLFNKLFSFIMRLLYATLVSHSLLAHLNLMLTSLSKHVQVSVSRGGILPICRPQADLHVGALYLH